MKDWLGFLMQTGPTWLHVLVKVATLLCLRVSEACRLHRDDIDFKKRLIRIGPLKRQPEVRKPLVPETLKVLLVLKTEARAASEHNIREAVGK